MAGKATLVKAIKKALSKVKGSLTKEKRAAIIKRLKARWSKASPSQKAALAGVAVGGAGGTGVAVGKGHERGGMKGAAAGAVGGMVGVRLAVGKKKK